MSADICKIYNGRKLIKETTCYWIRKNNIEYLEIPSETKVEPGNHLVINDKEKLYVTDVRIQHPNGKYSNVYFETVAQHRERIEAKTIAKASIVIAAIALVVSIVALVKSFFS